MSIRERTLTVKALCPVCQNRLYGAGVGQTGFTGYLRVNADDPHEWALYFHSKRRSKATQGTPWDDSRLAPPNAVAGGRRRDNGSLRRESFDIVKLRCAAEGHHLSPTWADLQREVETALRLSRTWFTIPEKPRIKIEQGSIQ